MDERPASGMPRWVKVSLLVVGGLIAVFVVLQFLGVGGEHGPDRHIGPRDHAPTATLR